MSEYESIDLRKRKYSLIDLLWKMKRGELLAVDYGICYHLTEHCADYRERHQAKQWMLEWPEHSGDELYPVQGTHRRNYQVQPEDAYDCCLNKWTGEYGASRKRLLNYLITRYGASSHA